MIPRSLAKRKTVAIGCALTMMTAACTSHKPARSQPGTSSSSSVLHATPAPLPPVTVGDPPRTPILETILDSSRIAPYLASGSFVVTPHRPQDVKAGKAIELRLRADGGTTLSVDLDKRRLPVAAVQGPHPELQQSGYYRISNPVNLRGYDPTLFYRVLVTLPLAQQGDFTLTVHSAAAASGKEAPPLIVNATRGPGDTPKASDVFFDGPDAKHTKYGLDGAFIADEVTLAGWLEKTPTETNDEGSAKTDDDVEDIHYTFLPDAGFIDRNYLPSMLSDAVMPGQWFTWFDNIAHPKQPIPLTGGAQATAGTFLMPGAADMTVELNAWHKKRHGGLMPTHWFPDPDPKTHSDLAWPFRPLTPPGVGPDKPLQAGDYVIVNGALVEDSSHLHKPKSEFTADDWRDQCWMDRSPGHGGWLEIHPLNAIRRVDGPAAHDQAQLVQVCSDPDPAVSTPDSAYEILQQAHTIPPTHKSVLRWQRIIDARFSDMSTVTLSETVASYDPSKLIVHASQSPRGDYIRFKAVYMLWWEEGSTDQPPAWPPPSTTPTRPPSTDPPICAIKPDLRQCKAPR